MGKKRSLIFLIFLFSLLFPTPFSVCTAYENNIEDDRFIEDIFELLYQEKAIQKEKSGLANENISLLHEKLKGYEKRNRKSNKAVLFTRAEGHYRLNNYKKSYVLFYQLFLKMENKNDPLYSIVDERIKELANRVKPIKESRISISTEIPSLPIFLAMILLALLLALLIYDKNIRQRGSLEQQVYDSSILPEEKIMTLDQMREQDGRCSKKTLKEYQKKKVKKPWDNMSDKEKEKYKTARLIVKGYQMITEVNQFTPHPIKFISQLSFLKKISYFGQYTFVGILFAFLWLFAKYFGMCNLTFPEILFLIIAFIISCLSGIRIMAEKTIDALDELVSMLEPDEVRDTIGNLKIWIERLFTSPRQYSFFVIVMGIIIYQHHIRNDLILASGLINLDIVFCASLVLITSSLIWFMFGSIIFMNKIYNLRDLSMNPLSPAKTMGLEKLTSVIGTYNLVCSIVLSFGCSIAVYNSYLEGGSLIQGCFWFFFITPILIFCWIYPYIKIGELVKSKKIKRMHFVKIKIALFFNEWIKSEETILQGSEKQKELGKEDPEITTEMRNEKKRIYKKLKDMERYYTVFKKIEQSPDSYFDVGSALELIKVMGFPSLFALATAIISYYAKM